MLTDAMRQRLPNQLTILRLLLAAGFFASLNVYRYPDENTTWVWIALGMFILAAITDALDGYLARRWDVISTFGRVMDPFCDKVLILGAFIYLAGPRFVVPDWVEQGNFFTMATGIYPWMVVVIFARELFVTGIRSVVESRGVKFGSMLSGKAKMILQSIIIPIVLVLVVGFETGSTPWAMWTCHVLVYATVIVTAWSGLPYIFGARRALLEAEASA